MGYSKLANKYSPFQYLCNANTNGSIFNLGLHVDVMQNNDVFSKWKVNINGEYLNSKHS